MSRIALSCLLLTAACAYGAFLGPETLPVPKAACKAGLAVFGTLFLLALMMGRKIKFDPVLR